MNQRDVSQIEAALEAAISKAREDQVGNALYELGKKLRVKVMTENGVL